jgi:ubiquinone/menaquinone biosynthesis C-methylase UbiE
MAAGSGIVRRSMWHFESVEDVVEYAESYRGWGPSARFFRSRMHLISQVLESVSGGDLLDAGCGPGMMIQDLMQRRPGDFTIVAVDSSLAMIAACQQRVGDATGVGTLVARVEALPFEDASFDVVLAMGVLEYTDILAATGEIARVSRPGALVAVTMLNPTSPYRFFDWHIFAPLMRSIGKIQALLKVPVEKRHGPPPIDLRTYRKGELVQLMKAAGLRPVDVAYFDVTFLVPPVDRYLRRWARGWQTRPERTISRGWLRWLGTGFVVAAQRQVSQPTPNVGD